MHFGGVHQLEADAFLMHESGLFEASRVHSSRLFARAAPKSSAIYNDCEQGQGGDSRLAKVDVEGSSPFARSITNRKARPFRRAFALSSAFLMQAARSMRS